MTDSLKEALDQIGGPAAAAALLGFTSPRAIYKWLDRNALPRTEYTGETDYASTLAAAKGAKFTAKQLRDRFKPASRVA